MEVSRSKRTIQNMIFGFLYHILTIVLSFVSRTIFIHTLGTEYLGLNSIFTDVLKMLSMADLGFALAMSYSFYEPLAKQDYKKIQSLVAFFKKIYNFIALVVTILGLACTPFLKYIVNTEQEIPNLEIYYFFGLADVVISYLFVYKTTLLTADQREYMISRLRTVFSLLGTLLKIAVLIVWHNYILYLAVNVSISFLTNLYASKMAIKEYPVIEELNNAEPLDKKSKDEIVATLKAVVLYKVSMLLYNYTDNILISMLIGTAMVGIFSNYWMLSIKLILIEQIVFASMTASVGNLIVKESEEKRLEVFEAMQSVSDIFCGIITCMFGILANDMIYVWLGKEFQLPLIAVFAIALNTYFTCILQPMAIFREATGLYNKIKYVMLIGSLLNIVLSVILGVTMGLSGIIFASVISRVATYAWYEPKIMYRDYFGTSSKSYMLDLFKNFALVLIILMGLIFVSSRFVPQDWGQMFIKAGIVGLFCTITFIGIYIRTPGAKRILNKMRCFVNIKREKK